jgi:hypothetical protein
MGSWGYGGYGAFHAVLWVIILIALILGIIWRVWAAKHSGASPRAVPAPSTKSKSAAVACDQWRDVRFTIERDILCGARHVRFVPIADIPYTGSEAPKHKR